MTRDLRILASAEHLRDIGMAFALDAEIFTALMQVAASGAGFSLPAPGDVDFGAFLRSCPTGPTPPPAAYRPDREGVLKV